MDFKRFENEYNRTMVRKKELSYDIHIPDYLEEEVFILKDYFTSFGGCSFQNGLFRIATVDYSIKITSIFEEMFPGLRRNILVIGFDWLGRHFAIDHRFEKKQQKQILLLEPGSGEALEIPGDIEHFLNDVLINMKQDALAELFFNEWRQKDMRDLRYSESIGYKIPLFLGGEDILQNLEVIDTEVYVSLCSQLRKKTKTLLPGQTIKEIYIQ